MRINSEQRRRDCGTSVDCFKKTAIHWANVCRSHELDVAGMRKVADGGYDTPFEQAFANLAHVTLAEKAPKLLDYELGFQLLDRKDDNTKAFGVFGFKVGSQYLYAPVIFLNGVLKGTELLLIKDQNLFVPLDEDWETYLLGRKQLALGKPTDRDTTQLGVLAPNLYQLSRSPYKIASATPKMADWAVDFLPMFADAVLTKVAADRADRFTELLGSLGEDGAEFITKVAESYPVLYGTILEAYGTEKIASTLAKIDSDISQSKRVSLLKVAEAPQKKAESVQVYLRQEIRIGNMPALAEPEREELMSNGRLVKDQREDGEKSIVYSMSEPLSLFNPAETGIYQVLVRPHKLERCLVIIGPIGREGRSNFCTIVSLERKGLYRNTDPASVHCKSQESRNEWNEWFDKLSDADSLSINERDRWNSERVVILSRDGTGTCPLRARMKYVDSISDSYEISFDNYCRSNSHSFHGNSYSSRPTILKGRFEVPDADMDSLRFTGRQGSQFRCTKDELQVPRGFKKFVVREADPSYGPGPASESSTTQAKPEVLIPGDPSDILEALYQGSEIVTLTKSSGDLHLNGQKVSKPELFKDLIEKWGLDASDAAKIENNTDEMKSKQTYAIVRRKPKPTDDKPPIKLKFNKKADPYLTGGGPSAPGLMEPPLLSDTFSNSRAAFQPEFQASIPVPSMLPDVGNRDKQRPIVPDPQAMQVAMQAASTGQREVFDTSMFSSLLDAVGDETMVDRYLSDLVKSMDRLARIYLQSLWHGKEFAERFGTSDMPEIVDGLRNTFKRMGKLVLKLKQKGVEHKMDNGMNVDLEHIAD